MSMFRFLHRPRLGAILVVLGTAFLGGCGTTWREFVPFVGPEPGPRILLARMDKAGRILILAEDLEIPGQYLDLRPIPYSANNSGAVWVGTSFPPEKAMQLMQWSKNYYTGLRYVALTDLVYPGNPDFNERLVIGAPTEEAVLGLKLAAWTENDWRELARIKAGGSREEFYALIRSKYP